MTESERSTIIRDETERLLHEHGLKLLVTIMLSPLDHLRFVVLLDAGDGAPPGDSALRQAAREIASIDGVDAVHLNIASQQ